MADFGFQNFRLTPDLQNFSNLIGNAIETRRVENKEADRVKALAEAQEKVRQIKETGFQLGRIRDITDPHERRKALAILGQRMHKAGQDNSVVFEALNINDVDEQGLFLTQEFIKSKSFSDKFDELMIKQGGDFKAGTTIGKARQDLNAGLITQDQFDRFVSGELAETESKEPNASTDLGKINQDFKRGHITQEQRDQLVNASLVESAQEIAGKELLDAKDLVGVNDKVSALLKPTVEITNAAKALEGLEERGTPAAQLAAVFKFMKANDPTSTVRESEQGQVYSAEGAMKGMAAQINQFLGEGGLSKSNFMDLSDTAKTIANSSIQTSQSQMQQYLNVISDNLTPVQLNRLQERVPQAFEISELTPEEQAELDALEAELGDS